MRITALTTALVVVAVGVMAISNGCTENTRAKFYGGTMTVNIQEGKKLVTSKKDFCRLLKQARLLAPEKILPAPMPQAGLDHR